MDEWIVIHAYSRAQALADGTLVDASELAREAGFRIPVALTRAVWEDCVAWTDADTDRTRIYQDPVGRLWDVLIMARFGAMAHRNSNRAPFKVARVPREGKRRMTDEVELIAHIGPGDTADPVFTIMLPHED